MGWCERNHVDYSSAWPRNQRLRKIIGAQMHQAHMLHQSTGKAARVFAEFDYRTHKSWSRARRVVAKAEYLDKGENPRFVVTSLTAEQWAAQDLYEKFYCARGEMENRIKEQMCLFADRLSTDEMKGNQLRLYFSALAYTLMEALRRLALKGTDWAQAQVDTIRLKLFKIGAIVRISARRILLQTQFAPIPGKTSTLTPSTPCAADLCACSDNHSYPSRLNPSAGRSHAQNPSPEQNRLTHVLKNYPKPMPARKYSHPPPTPDEPKISDCEKCGLGDKRSMSRFKVYSPDQAYLLPPSVRHELGSGRLCFFVREVIERLDMSVFVESYSAEGGELYAPQLMLGVWLYAYALGITSARQVERRVVEDLAFRYLAAGERVADAIRRRDCEPCSRTILNKRSGYSNNSINSGSSFVSNLFASSSPSCSD